MWLYIPETTSRSTQAEAVSIEASDSRIQLLSQSYTWNESFKPPRSWLTILKRASWSLRLFGLIPEPSIAPRLLDEWIGSLEDSHANPAVQLELGGERPILGGFGPIFGGSCTKRGHKGCSWRTCEDSYQSMMDELSRKYSGTWPVSASMRNGVYYEHPMLERPTDVNGCSSWLTPFGSGNMDHTGKYGAGGEFAKSVLKTVKAWATPTGRDYKDGANPSPAVKTNSLLGRQAPRTPMPGEQFSNEDQTSPRRLNYRFVEILMGLSSRWTDFHALLD